LNDGEPGNTKVFYDQQEKWFRMERGSISVICNLGDAEHTFRVPEGSRALLASSEAVSMTNESVTLVPDTIAVLNTDPIMISAAS
jgi:maltooligosyltrehalose trehalohydrolase